MTRFRRSPVRHDEGALLPGYERQVGYLWNDFCFAGNRSSVVSRAGIQSGVKGLKRRRNPPRRLRAELEAKIQAGWITLMARTLLSCCNAAMRTIEQEREREGGDGGEKKGELGATRCVARVWKQWRRNWANNKIIVRLRTSPLRSSPLAFKHLKVPSIGVRVLCNRAGNFEGDWTEKLFAWRHAPGSN